MLERIRAALAARYAVEHEIGAGGMATVYLARDLKPWVPPSTGTIQIPSVEVPSSARPGSSISQGTR